MSDLLSKVEGDKNPLMKLVGKIPGFKGYMASQDRRNADALLRETIVKEYTEVWKRVGELQQDFANAGEIMVLDDLEKAAMKLQTFIDKIETAARGYSGWFDSVKVDEAALTKVYEFDVALLENVETISSAVSNIQQSVGTDGLPAAIRHLISLTRDLVATFEGRREVIKTL